MACVLLWHHQRTMLGKFQIFASLCKYLLALMYVCTISSSGPKCILAKYNQFSRIYRILFYGSYFSFLRQTINVSTSFVSGISKWNICVYSTITYKTLLTLFIAFVQMMHFHDHTSSSLIYSQKSIFYDAYVW